MRGDRLAVTESGWAPEPSLPLSLGCRLSRYPTRTAPAVPGHVDTCLRQLPTVTGLPRAARAPLPHTGLDDVSGHVWPSAGSSQAGSQGAVGAEIVGGRGRWRR